MNAPTPRTSPPFPLEILLHILEHAVAVVPDNWATRRDRDAGNEARQRSRELALFALVSRQFHSCANSMLYEELGVAWQAGTVRLFLRSVRANPRCWRRQGALPRPRSTIWPGRTTGSE